MRTSPSAPPPMVRHYCILIGTRMHYYNSEEEATHRLSLKGEVDVQGVSTWDGKGNVHIYTNAFIFGTSQSKFFYAYADTPMELEMWLRAIHLVVATNITTALERGSGQLEVASPALQDITPNSIRFLPPSVNSSIALLDPDTTPSASSSPILHSCGACPEGLTSSASNHRQCINCGGYFCDKHASREIPLPHCGFSTAQRVCEACYRSQGLLNYLKGMTDRLTAGIVVYSEKLDVNNPIKLLTPARPSHTPATNIALKMYDDGTITADELEELLKADRRYQNHTAEEPEIPLDIKILAMHRTFRLKTFSVGDTMLLLHRHLESNPMLFKPIVEKLLRFSYSHLLDIEFHWPQIFHAYLRLPSLAYNKLWWMDELILSICARSIHLGLLLMWHLQGALEDAMTPGAAKDTEATQPRMLRLMVMIEMDIIGKELGALLSGKGEPQSLRASLPQATDVQIARIAELLTSLRDSKAATPLSKLNQKKSQVMKQMEFQQGAIQQPPPRAASTSPLRGRQRNHSVTSNTELLKQKTSLARISSSSPETYKRKMADAKLADAKMALVMPEGGDAVTYTSLDASTTTSRSSVPSSLLPSPPPCLKLEGDDDTDTGLTTPERSLLATYYSDERAFVNAITDIAEQLRFITPTTARKTVLRARLAELTVPEMVYLPLINATDAFVKIMRIPPNEAMAFSTKARVPIMLIFEVIRGSGPTAFESWTGVTPGGLRNPWVLLDESTSGRSQSSTNHTPAGGLSRGKIFEVDDEVEALLDTETMQHLHNGDGSRCEEHHLGETMGSEEEEEEKEGQGLPVPLHEGLEKTPSSQERTFSSPTPDTHPVTFDPCSLEGHHKQREDEGKADLELAFGESWGDKRRRLKALSPYGDMPGWDIVSMIGKSNDDLRQEVFALQLIQKFSDVFAAAHLPLWLKPYRIIGTSSSTGLIETLVNAISLDGLKKREGYVSLVTHFEKSYGPVDSGRFTAARANLIHSMAAYSLVTYLLQIKDRHNGNIMLLSQGHIVHIDFGFLLGIAPGGSFSIETAPFKLTAEMVQAMGGVGSESFKEFVSLVTRGFIACQQQCESLCDFVDMMARQSPFPCFIGTRDPSALVAKFRARFKVGLTKKETVDHILTLIRKSNSNYSTRQYDNFQYMTNGIFA